MPTPRNTEEMSMGAGTVRMALRMAGRRGGGAWRKAPEEKPGTWFGVVVVVLAVVAVLVVVRFSK